jgi:hypothetical protein
VSQPVGVLIGAGLAALAVTGFAAVALYVLALGLRDAVEFRPRVRAAVPWLLVALAIAAVIAAAAYID